MDNQQGQELEQFAQMDPSVRAQEAMLRMGRDMQAQGHVYEALDTYTKLLDNYPDTQGARAAANAMVELAQYLEQNGMPRMALHIYEILEQYQ